MNFGTKKLRSKDIKMLFLGSCWDNCLIDLIYDDRIPVRFGDMVNLKSETLRLRTITERLEELGEMRSFARSAAMQT